MFGDGELDSPSADEFDLATTFLPVLRALSLVGTHQENLPKASLFDPLRLFYKALTHRQTGSSDGNPRTRIATVFIQNPDKVIKPDDTTKQIGERERGGERERDRRREKHTYKRE